MLKEGMIVGERYEIIGRVGSGGMADVYKARDHKLNRMVAFKVLKAEFSNDTNSLFSRTIVRAALNASNAIDRTIPKRIRDKISSRCV